MSYTQKISASTVDRGTDVSKHQSFDSDATDAHPLGVGVAFSVSIRNFFVKPDSTNFGALLP